MADVVGIVFQSGGKVYYFDPASLELAHGEQVVVQTMRGTEIGEVVDGPREVPDGELPAPLKRVVRKANIQDVETVQSNIALRAEAMTVCRDLIRKHGLEMKLVDAEIVFGGGKIIFSFSAEERIDFRALVSDLAKVLKMRIELRQIGAREETRILGGLGPCGRDLCCSLFQGDQDPVSIRMAKEQNLPLNPMKISGLCGRLMCCLKYEQEQYVCFRKEVPNRGTKVQTESGEGVVVGFQLTKESLTLRMPDGSLAEVPLSRCGCGGAPCGDAPCGGAAESEAAAGGTVEGGSPRGRREGNGQPPADPARAQRTAAAPPEDAGRRRSGTVVTSGDVADDAGEPESGGAPAAGEESEGRRSPSRSRRRRRRSRKSSGGGQGGQQGS
ncbi:MAG TPA: stage 0 sporulation family protein [Thermoleophilia bacterium]|nr:stage 0 sporulation family protein [Thermoleophilia bacterium]